MKLNSFIYILGAVALSGNAFGQNTHQSATHYPPRSGKEYCSMSRWEHINASVASLAHFPKDWYIDENGDVRIPRVRTREVKAPNGHTKVEKWISQYTCSNPKDPKDATQFEIFMVEGRTAKKEYIITGTVDGKEISEVATTDGGTLTPTGTFEKFFAPSLSVAVNLTDKREKRSRAALGVLEYRGRNDYSNAEIIDYMDKLVSDEKDQNGNVIKDHGFGDNFGAAATLKNGVSLNSLVCNVSVDLMYAINDPKSTSMADNSKPQKKEDCDCHKALETDKGASNLAEFAKQTVSEALYKNHSVAIERAVDEEFARVLVEMLKSGELDPYALYQFLKKSGPIVSYDPKTGTAVDGLGNVYAKDGKLLKRGEKGHVKKLYKKHPVELNSNEQDLTDEQVMGLRYHSKKRAFEGHEAAILRSYSGGSFKKELSTLNKAFELDAQAGMMILQSISDPRLREQVRAASHSQSYQEFQEIAQNMSKEGVLSEKAYNVIRHVMQRSTEIRKEMYGQQTQKVADPVETVQKQDSLEVKQNSKPVLSKREARKQKREARQADRGKKN